MSAERILMCRILELDEGDNLLSILTKLPKSVPYTDLIFQVEAEEFDGRAFAKAWFQYQSLETDEEYENRIKLQKIRQQNDEARERRQYEFLKAKYGVLRDDSLDLKINVESENR